jgi:hypothetical protein
MRFSARVQQKHTLPAFICSYLDMRETALPRAKLSSPIKMAAYWPNATTCFAVDQYMPPLYAMEEQQQTYRSSKDEPKVESKRPSLDVVSHNECDDGEYQTQDCRDI